MSPTETVVPEAALRACLFLLDHDFSGVETMKSTTQVVDAKKLCEELQSFCDLLDLYNRGLADLAPLQAPKVARTVFAMLGTSPDKIVASNFDTTTAEYLRQVYFTMPWRIEIEVGEYVSPVWEMPDAILVSELRRWRELIAERVSPKKVKTPSRNKSGEISDEDIKKVESLLRDSDVTPKQDIIAEKLQMGKQKVSAIMNRLREKGHQNIPVRKKRKKNE